MATPAYDGGIGGKFRKRPFRRTTATPYDRPPSVVRALRGHSAEAGGNRWLSKLVDPASRFIAGSASRIFSSVFRKRLTAPPQAAEENHHTRRDVPDVACIDTASKLLEGDRDGDNPTHSDADGICEVEQLLMQKTFTSDEFNRLAELLRSRTVELAVSEPVVKNEKKEMSNVAAQENGVGHSKLHENLSSFAHSLTIPQDEAASPAELAKAYMNLRPKVSSSAVGLRSQVYQKDTNLSSNVPSTSNTLDLSVAPRSVIRFSGATELPGNGHQTPRSRGRSAIYRMSRSPYFKGGEHTRVQYTSPYSSQWTPNSANALHSGGKQVLKRGSSVLDSDLGSFGPIRRIRQKSNLMSPSKDRRSVPGNLLSSPSISLDEDVIKDSTSVRKPLLLDERKYNTAGFQDASAASLPPQSSDTARKILQQLDQLMPSPKEKSSELITISRDQSPSKLTVGMLHGRAIRSMEDIDSSKFLNLQGNGNLDTITDSNLPTLRGSLSQKLERVKENGPSKSDVIGVNLTSEANGTDNAVISTTEPRSGMIYADSVVMGSAILPSQKKPSFQISAPEDSLELDDENYNTEDVSSPLTTGKDEVESKTPEQKAVISETAVGKNSLMCSSESMPISSSMSFREADKKASVGPVSEKDNGFTFPVATGSSGHSQLHSTLTMPTPLLEKSSTQQEQAAASVFAFGSKTARSDLFSSNTTIVGDTSEVKAAADSGAELKLSTSNANTTTPVEGSNVDEGSRTQKAGDLFKSYGGSGSSGISASAVFAFDASTAPSLSNGSIHLSSPTFSISATTVAAISPSPVTTIFSKSTATAATSTSPSFSPAAPLLSTVPLFQFGSGTTSTAPVSVSLPLQQSNSVDLGATAVKGLPFSIPSSTAQDTPVLFSSTGSSSYSDVKTSAFPSTGVTSSVLATSAVSSIMGSSSAAIATSSLFSGMEASGSAYSSSSVFPSTGSNISGFGASTQSSSLSLSFASNSSHKSATALGATGGSIFGTQSSTQSGSGNTQFSQSSTSQLGSLSSSPSFGLSNSSSSSFGIPPFVSAASTAKPFSSSSGFSFSTGAGSSSASSSTSVTSGLFGSTSQTYIPALFGSSTASSPSTGFSFGLSASGVGSTPFTFGSSSGSAFSFTSTGAATLSTSSRGQPLFGIPTSPAVGGFSSGSPGNDQMNVEDSMGDDTNQAAAPMVPTFGQPANPPAMPGFVFGSPAVPSGGSSVFQFGSHQNPSVPQSPSPFQPASNLEFTPGGSFSLGSGGGDKSGRKIVKVRRDKMRKK